ncbi:hypothetical protein FCU45_11425 [Sulfurimonas crateris]|uniref:Glycosyltransferase RgtA/B/C/D-like domain-containing protein n=1 Tax=Sulfurimonas crateris TaxID=2574727 RepID=A0A4U2Z2G4_9BACT|nr:hypothetical protein [Sulfurimonas crateris]TKI68307.1 hypothetical protein FCU45_11425 [Sulfurimonas crateris]
MSIRNIFFLIIGLDALWLALQIGELSISYNEAEILNGDFSFLQLLINSSIMLFGQNDFALRLPMILLHILSAILLYDISKNYIKVQRNRLWLLIIFILLPGVISSSIIVNSAGLVLFGLLLFVYIYENYSIKYSYILLLFYMLIDGGFSALFMGLLFYSLYKKDRKFLLFNLVMFLSSLSIYGIDTHGSPKGYFLDSIGIYAAIFSPIIFIYLFYTLYRRYLTKEFDMLWFVSTVALLFSLLLSFRQRVPIEYFAPYVILSLPLVAQTFEHSYRVRLSLFRRNYRLAFVISLVLLLINSSVVFFNKYLYYVIEEPKKHFSYKMHVAKELAQELKVMGIECINSDEKMSKRLEFYGVTKCNNYLLEEISADSTKEDSVTISYKNRAVYSANVTKIYTN